MFHAIQRFSTSTLSTSSTGLTIHALNATFPYIWLRDSCPDSLHPTTLQKLHRSSDIPVDIRPAHEDSISLKHDKLSILWSDGHQSTYPLSFLERHSSPEKLSAFHHDDAASKRVAWTAQSITKSLDLFVPYGSLDTPSGFLAALNQLSRYGLLFITAVPTKETSNEFCEARSLAHRFGDLRTTFYGDTWDVKNVRNSRNIAYTNLDLGYHMDLLYFEHPPRYQILHCLRNRVVGGTSLFVDALHASQTLRSVEPDSFRYLTTTPVAFHYINDGHHLHRTHNTVVLSPTSDSLHHGGEDISHINYSPPFQAPLPLSTPPTFYTALSKFAKLISEPEREFNHTLKEGEAVLFDNRRVLHARTAFTDGDRSPSDKGVDGETNRWLKGCYFEGDALADRRRVLQAKLARPQAS